MTSDGIDRWRWCAGGVLAIAAGVGMSACAEVGSAGAPEERTVLVDYIHDEIAASFLSYFPDDMIRSVQPLLDEWLPLPEDEIPHDVLAAFDEATAALPYMLDDRGVSQNMAQPCFRTVGGPNQDPRSPCTAQEQRQPDFDGEQTFYNSGFIPYEGEGGNQFRVTLADDITPGTYSYYCAVHGALQNGTITVVAPGSEIPSQAAVSRQGLLEVEEQARPLIESFERAAADVTTGATPTLHGAGLAAPIVGCLIHPHMIGEVVVRP